MASPITKLFTVDDCYKMAKVGILPPDERIELIAGELIVVSPPGPRHGAAVDRANRALLLLVEVAESTLDYDTTVKLNLYAILGIREYWVVDLQDDRLLVYSKPRGDSYQVEDEFRRGDTIAPKALPRCRLAVHVFFP